MIRVVCIVAAVITVCHRSPGATAFCTHPTDWWDPTEHALIPVKYSTTLPPLLRHADGTAWTAAEFKAELQHIIQMINDYNNSRMPRLYFAGTSSNEDQEENVIKVVPKPAGEAGWDASCWDQDTPGPEAGCLIRMPRYNCCGGQNKVFEPFLTSYPDDDNSATLAHEFTHVLGLAHPNSVCDPTWALCTSVLCDVAGMNAGVQEETAYFIDDTNGYRARYGGSYNGAREHHERLSASWYQLTGSVVPTQMPLPGLSDNASGSSYMAMSSRRETGQTVRFHRWVHSTQAWDYWGVLTRPGVGSLGAAYTPSNGTGYFMFQQTETKTDTDKRLTWTKLTGFSSSPPSILGHASTTTRRHGVDGTYDPKSGKLVVVTRAVYVPNETEHWQVVLHVVDPTSGANLGTWRIKENDVPLMASDTPSVACAPATVDYNCILVWAEAAQPGNVLGTKFHAMRSMHFKLTLFLGAYWLNLASPVVIGPNASTAYVAYGRPDVTYRGPTSSSAAFEVVWSEPSTTILTRVLTRSMTKAVGATSNWINLRSFAADNSPRTSASIGSAFQYSEAVRHK